jgi:hypothetical protein
MHALNHIWKPLFFLLIGGYCLYYAPYGINETDGGFITGLAWQVLSGKIMYQEIAYVRPPMPVLLRAGELLILPDQWAILGERWIFYMKVGLYSWLAASILTSGTRRWLLACIGFLVSAHNYPAAAWHTIDGITFSVLGWWLLLGSFPAEKPMEMAVPATGRVVLAALAIFCATLCKQSFYPQPLVFAGVLFLYQERKTWMTGLLTLALSYGAYFGFLSFKGILPDYFRYTAGATTRSLALEHGLLDYFHIKPILVLLSAALLIPAGWLMTKATNQGDRRSPMAFYLWLTWLAALIGSYAWAIHANQGYTIPFAQSRLLVVLSFIFMAWAWYSGFWNYARTLRVKVLLILSWCTAISWGFNLPILFIVPCLYILLAISDWLLNNSAPEFFRKYAALGAICSVISLAAVFRYAYEFVYRDGRRSEMTVSMGAIFPPLSGIYSDQETASLYLDLKQLTARYGPNFKTLPSFSQASFLCRSYPPLPLDWVVKRENNGLDDVLLQQLKARRPVLFIEKHYGQQLETDPEMPFTRMCMARGRVLEETPHFLVISTETIE